MKNLKKLRIQKSLNRKNKKLLISKLLKKKLRLRNRLNLKLLLKNINLKTMKFQLVVPMNRHHLKNKNPKKQNRLSQVRQLCKNLKKIQLNNKSKKKQLLQKQNLNNKLNSQRKNQQRKSVKNYLKKLLLNNQLKKLKKMVRYLVNWNMSSNNLQRRRLNKLQNINL